MSLFSKIMNKAAPALATFGKFIPGIGTAVSLGATAYMGLKGRTSTGGAPASPGQMSAGMFPGLGSLNPMARMGAVGAGVRYGVAGAKRVYGAAAGYCRKHPQWCATIGGIAAVEAMIGRGELPIPKRRRGKGLTATELKNFKRVAKFTSKYCAPVRRAMSAPAVRRGKSCQ